VRPAIRRGSSRAVPVCQTIQSTAPPLRRTRPRRFGSRRHGLDHHIAFQLGGGGHGLFLSVRPNLTRRFFGSPKRKAPATIRGGFLALLSQKFLVRRSQLTTIVICGVVALPAAFVAMTVKVYVPGVVGFPVRSPLRSSDNPVGSEPDSTPNVGAGKPSALKR
jgi:hypothetical protein